MSDFDRLLKLLPPEKLVPNPREYSPSPMTPPAVAEGGWSR
jgi:hypothetical protein